MDILDWAWAIVGSEEPYSKKKHREAAAIFGALFQWRQSPTPQAAQETASRHRQEGG
jgi:hypothetical protein